MNKYAGLIKCAECEHSFKGRLERNRINYRCNYRLKYGTSKCINDSKIEEKLLDDMIEQQLYVLDIKEVEDIKNIVEKILVSTTKVEIFFKNLPIHSCYIDEQSGKVHYDSNNN